MAKAKHVPQRMCTVCRAHKEKGNLIRIVNTPQGEILVDKTGKIEGRGIYICKDIECISKVKKQKRLERAFSAIIPPEIFRCLDKVVENDET